MNVSPSPEVFWRFFDRSKTWRVSLANNFVAIETLNYGDRREFLGRLYSIVDALAATIEPSPATRIGYRYINRIVEFRHISILSELVNERLIGFADSTFVEHVEQSLTDARYRTKEGNLLVALGAYANRWKP